MKFLFILFTFLFIPITNACLNLSGTNLEGETKSLDLMPYFVEINDSPDQKTIRKKLNELQKKLAQSKDKNKNEIYTDIAVYMIYNGDYQDAITYLHKNVTDKYNNYSFCSNIGVAHELVGNIDSALYWTKRGVEINSESHYESEWIHVRILEVKREMEKNKNWLNENNIFDFAVSQDSAPTIFPPDFYYREFAEQLGFQLFERSYFVKPNGESKIMAQLILIFADIIAREYDTKECIPNYELAGEYNNALLPLVTKRIAFLTDFDAKNGLENYEYTDHTGYNINHDNKKNKILNPEEKPKKKLVKNIEYYLIGGFVVLIILLIFFIRKK